MKNSNELFPKRKKITLSCNSAIALLRVYTKNESGYERDIFTVMFIAELFVTAKIWK